MAASALTIVGIGSPFGDDQVGWAVSERLTAWQPTLEAEIVQSKAPAVDLLQILADAERAVLVDAVDTGLPAGTVQRWSGDEITRVSSAVSTHGFDVGQVLALGNRLGLIPDDIVLYGISVDPSACSPMQAEISAAVADAVDIAAARIAEDSQRQAAAPVHAVPDSIGTTTHVTQFNGSGD